MAPTSAKPTVFAHRRRRVRPSAPPRRPAAAPPRQPGLRPSASLLSRRRRRPKDHPATVLACQARWRLLLRGAAAGSSLGLHRQPNEPRHQKHHQRHTPTDQPRGDAAALGARTRSRDLRTPNFRELLGHRGRSERFGLRRGRQFRQHRVGQRSLHGEQHFLFQAACRRRQPPFAPCAPRPATWTRSCPAALGTTNSSTC